MFKFCILFALAIASAAAQEAPASGEAAPEPYSYGYQTDTHAASEQRDPSGKVTGFYTLVDTDGRERRVEYVADEAGFRAKIATNEVGTKSESPADVEILASEPTPGQFVYQSQSQQVQAAPAPVVRQQFVQQPARSQVQYVQQPAGYNYGYGYYPGYGYSNQAYGSGYGTGYNTGYGYYPSYGYGNQGYGLSVGNYNNHLPSQYYRSTGSTSSGVVAPSTYSVGGQNVRYASQPAVSGVRTVNYPGAVTYGSSYSSYGVPVGTVGSSARTVGTSSNLQGSSNYLVLQKRATAAGTAAATEEKKSS